MKLGISVPELEPARRVIQCACGCARPFRGELAAWREGWACEWVSVGRGRGRRWTCPACASPAAPCPAEEPTTAPPLLLELVHLRRDELAREQLALLLERDPSRGRAALAAISVTVKRWRKANRGPWPGWLAELGAARRLRKAG